MLVSELIEKLKQYPQDTHVVIDKHSEYCLVDEFEEIEACQARNDGWVAHKRPDKEFQKYLLIY